MERNAGALTALAAIEREERNAAAAPEPESEPPTPTQSAWDLLVADRPDLQMIGRLHGALDGADPDGQVQLSAADAMALAKQLIEGKKE